MGCRRGILILELCRGGSLRAAISRKRRLKDEWTPETVRKIVLEIARGLGAAHTAGLTHRDLKPENILFATRDQGSIVKLADFGLAGLFHDDTGRLRSLTGSPAYMAPEQFSGSFQPASDVYSLGIIAVELLRGEIPFSGTPEQMAYQHLQESISCEEFPKPWKTLLPKMLAKAPSDRPTAAEVVKALRSASPRTKIVHEQRFAGKTGSLLAGPIVAIALDNETITLDSRRIPLGQARRLGTCQRNGDWIQTDEAVIACSDLRVLISRPAGLDCWQAFSDEGGLATLQIRGDHVCLMREGEAVWSIEIAGGGLKRHLAVHTDGSFAVTDFLGSPGLQVRDRFGQLISRIQMPGIALQIVPWSRERRFALRMLTGDGVSAYSTKTRGGLMPLPGGSRVGFLWAGVHGIASISTDGTPRIWNARRRQVLFDADLPQGESLCGLSLGKDSVDVLSVAERATILRQHRWCETGEDV